MSMLWPGYLLLLGLIPLMIAVYVWVLRRRRRYAVRFSSLALVRQALPRWSRLRRHLPFALFLIALSSLVMAAARPVSVVEIPSGQVNIILAMDVSWSMCSIDIRPNRLAAAQDAALSFIQRQNPNTQIGIVAFAGFSVLVQPPTNDQEALEAAVKGLNTARRTAIGSAILESLEAIAELNSDIAPPETDLGFGEDFLPDSGGSAGDPSSGPNSPGESSPGDNLSGEYAPDIIVLLTDGASNSGPHPLDAAQQAVERRVRVYTIGFGTENGSMMDCGRQFFGGDSFGGGGNMFGGGSRFGGGFRRGIDEETLIAIADLTGGEYYSATSAHELQEVFRNLPTHLTTREETTEIGFAFVFAGALLAALAILLAMLWQPMY